MANGHPSGHMAATSSTNPWTARVTQRPDPCGDDCTPRCPACGGLKCSCRPRFFPGQLLTDRELNGLEQYVIDKNKLHNTYLHGWGVACGLEVVCDDCDRGHVTVKTGYAVSPCGDDIVLCADQSVDVCALINACEPRQPNCDNPYDVPQRDCTGGVRKWVLAVCYDEKPVRGITAQLGAGDSPGRGRCSCGGGGSCGCGGRASGGSASGGCDGGKGCSCGGSRTATSTGRQYKPQCEPTQVCEGYRFIAYPAPKDTRLDAPTRGDGSGDLMWAWLYANRSRFGPLIDRVLCCVTRAMELRQSIREGAKPTGAQGVQVLTDYVEALSAFAEDFAIHDCTFVDKVRRLRDDTLAYAKTSPQLKPATFGPAVSSRLVVLDNLWMDIVSECLCAALLPGCPTPPSTNCVPLAVVTISGEDCRVVDVCNWAERKILISWPTISYWLSWLPWKRLSKWILDLCCGSERNSQAYGLLAVMFATIFNQEPARATAMGGLSAAFAKGPAAMGTDAAPAPGIGPKAEPANPLSEALASDDFLGHMLEEVSRIGREGTEGTGQPEWMGIVSRVIDGSVLTPRPIADPNVVELTRRLDLAETQLKAQDSKLRAQASRIAVLDKKVGKS